MPISPTMSYADVNKREMRSHGSFYFPAACYEPVLPEMTIPWHWHDELELINVKKGRVRLWVGAHKLILNEGEGVFINGDVLHTVGAASEDSAQIQSIVFHPRLIAAPEDRICWDKYIRPLLDNKLIPMQSLSEETEWQADILTRLQRAWHQIASDQYGFELRVRNELSEIILKLINHQNLKVAEVPKKTRQNDERLKKMLLFIHNNYSKPLTLGDIAEASMISKSACLRCFKDVLETTPLKYVNHYRLSVAAQYLETTDWQISEIGGRCGFNEMGYFAARFRESYGMTPKAYRRIIAERGFNGR